MNRPWCCLKSCCKYRISLFPLFTALFYGSCTAGQCNTKLLYLLKYIIYPYNKPSYTCQRVSIYCFNVILVITSAFSFVREYHKNFIFIPLSCIDM